MKYSGTPQTLAMRRTVQKSRMNVSPHIPLYIETSELRTPCYKDSTPWSVTVQLRAVPLYAIDECFNHASRDALNSDIIELTIATRYKWNPGSILIAVCNIAVR